MADQVLARPSSRQVWGAGLLGLALGGFFDGILLHQVLQWHHLLSLVQGEAYRDIRTQILADGLFHVLMYAIAMAGIWLLWRGRRDEGRGNRLILASAVLGFSLWQFLDVVLFHWIMVIHRIRVDVPDPLVWDVAWMVVFGVPTLVWGLWLLRTSDRGGPSGPLRRAPVAAMLAIAALVAGPVAALPPPGVTTRLVLFTPGTGAAGAFAAVAAIDGRVLWADPAGELLAIDVGDRNAAALYRHGALLVSSSYLAGCLAWSRV